MGNMYPNHTGLLKVDGEKRTLTIATAQAVSNMKFWYYTNGSVDGDTVEITPTENVTIAGTVYPLAFEFPIVENSDYVGVKFSAPIMPVSPSARIKIDYSTANPVASEAQTTSEASTTVATTAQTVSAQTTALPTTAAVLETSRETTLAQTTAAQTTTAYVTAESLTSAAPVTTTATVETTSQASSSSGSAFKNPLVIAIVIVAVKKKKENEEE